MLGDQQWLTLQDQRRINHPEDVLGLNRGPGKLGCATAVNLAAPRRDASQTCSPRGRVTITADLPI
jgi:hypothetical protein